MKSQSGGFAKAAIAITGLFLFMAPGAAKNAYQKDMPGGLM